MKSLTKVSFACFLFSCLLGQVETNSDQVRKIRLENFKNNYKGKTIRFTSENSKIVQGVLINITDQDFVISVNKSAMFYKHEKVDFVYLPPVSEDMYITASFSALGGLAGYVALIVAIQNPKAELVGTVTTLGAVLGFFVGKNAFYKTQKIDISGRLRD
tara:strand:- start:2239 stop:2715 length:477 start_codon:yes stop_codon:yes gene_type:complete